MYLSLDQKVEIIETFPELHKSIDKNGRISYFIYGSKQRRKQIIRELTHTGNGYIYGSLTPELHERVDNRGWINFKDCNERELRELIGKVIESFC